MELTLRPYTPADAALWDAFVECSWNGTFLHSRKFLSYHGSRFHDLSLLVLDEGRLVGVFPAALDPHADAQVVSHPGSSYGGLVHAGRLRGEAMVGALSAVAAWYRTAGFERLKYRAVPHVFQRIGTADDLYALFRLGAERYRSDLSSVIEYHSRAPISALRLRREKLARKSGLVVERGAHLLEGYWGLLERHLASRFGVAPTHSLAEIEHLFTLFPEATECVVARLERETVAGVVLFHHAETVHVQYAAADAAGFERSALDLVLSGCLTEAEGRGRRYFSFGTCCEQEGTVLNSGLYGYKNSFGAGSIVYEFYSLPILSGPAD